MTIGQTDSHEVKKKLTSQTFPRNDSLENRAPLASISSNAGAWPNSPDGALLVRESPNHTPTPITHTATAAINVIGVRRAGADIEPTPVVAVVMGSPLKALIGNYQNEEDR
jgi:hypothetical protein